jgi:hypothetical protein
VLQGLHNRGVLELLRGALGSSDKVLQSWWMRRISRR